MTDKITIERETLERAIEAFAMHANAYPHMLSDQELQSLRNWGNLAEEAADEICALRAALAAQPAEPVAWLWRLNHFGKAFLWLLTQHCARC